MTQVLLKFSSQEWMSMGSVFVYSDMTFPLSSLPVVLPLRLTCWSSIFKAAGHSWVQP